jgi:hypothetical protein
MDFQYFHLSVSGFFFALLLCAKSAEAVPAGTMLLSHVLGCQATAWQTQIIP